MLMTAAMLATLDIVTIALLALFALAGVSAACWLVHGLDNEDAER